MDNFFCVWKTLSHDSRDESIFDVRVESSVSDSSFSVLGSTDGSLSRDGLNSSLDKSGYD